MLDGDAEVRSAENTDAVKLREDLRAVYRAAANKEHPAWAEYDQAMRDQKRVVVVLRPGRVTARNAD